jgi:hypothetical protein
MRGKIVTFSQKTEEVEGSGWIVPILLDAIATFSGGEGEAEREREREKEAL